MRWRESAPMPNQAGSRNSDEDIRWYMMLMIDYRDMSWWYWLVTAILLSLGLFVMQEAFVGAILVTVCS